MPNQAGKPRPPRTRSKIHRSTLAKDLTTSGTNTWTWESTASERVSSISGAAVSPLLSLSSSHLLLPFSFHLPSFFPSSFFFPLSFLFLLLSYSLTLSLSHSLTLSLSHSLTLSLSHLLTLSLSHSLTLSLSLLLSYSLYSLSLLILDRGVQV